MKTRSPITRAPLLPAPISIGIVLQRRSKRPHLIDPNVTSTGCSPSTVTTADRAPAQRNTAVVHRLDGTSRSLITDGILAGVRNRPGSSPNRRGRDGVETIIDIVKSDADGIVSEGGYQMPPPVEHATGDSRDNHHRD